MEGKSEYREVRSEKREGRREKKGDLSSEKKARRSCRVMGEARSDLREGRGTREPVRDCRQKDKTWRNFTVQNQSSGRATSPVERTQIPPCAKLSTESAAGDSSPKVKRWHVSREKREARSEQPASREQRDERESQPEKSINFTVQTQSKPPSTFGKLNRLSNSFLTDLSTCYVASSPKVRRKRLA